MYFWFIYFLLSEYRDDFYIDSDEKEEMMKLTELERETILYKRSLVVKAHADMEHCKVWVTALNVLWKHVDLDFQKQMVIERKKRKEESAQQKTKQGVWYYLKKTHTYHTSLNHIQNW